MKLLRNKYEKWQINGIIFLLLTFALWTNDLSLYINNYSLHSDKIETSITITQVSDLHSTLYGKNQHILIDAIKESKPDIIALTGDIFQENISIDNARIFIEQVKNIAPTYYVTGNHEYLNCDINHIYQILEDNNIIILHNDYRIIEIKGNPIIICGIDDPNSTYNNDIWLNKLNNLWNNAKDIEGYKILLSHRPELYKNYANYDYDLILSGHAHGGQVRIPFILNGLIAPHQGFFPMMAGGEYKYNNTIHIVSRGLCINNLPRIFNPPELVVINVT